MKIYFEDGTLMHPRLIPAKIDFIVDATKGVSNNIETLDLFKERCPNSTIYTNSIFAFSNEYAWNNKLNVPEIYIRSGDHMTFTRIDKLTDKELRYAHNLAKMYIAGAFNT